MNVKQAKDHLEINGFYVYNLWQVSDVQNMFECTDEQAQEVLHDALTNDYISERIFNEITDYATMRGFVEKKEVETSEEKRSRIQLEYYTNGGK